MTIFEKGMFDVPVRGEAIVAYTYGVYNNNGGYSDSITLGQYLKASEVLKIYNKAHSQNNPMTDCMLDDMRVLKVDFDKEWYNNLYGFNEVDTYTKMTICNAWRHKMYDL